MDQRRPGRSEEIEQRHLAHRGLCASVTKTTRALHITAGSAVAVKCQIGMAMHQKGSAGCSAVSERVGKWKKPRTIAHCAWHCGGPRGAGGLLQCACWPPIVRQTATALALKGTQTSRRFKASPRETGRQPLEQRGRTPGRWHFRREGTVMVYFPGRQRA